MRALESTRPEALDPCPWHWQGAASPGWVGLRPFVPQACLWRWQPPAVDDVSRRLQRRHARPEQPVTACNTFYTDTIGGPCTWHWLREGCAAPRFQAPGRPVPAQVASLRLVSWQPIRTHCSRARPKNPVSCASSRHALLRQGAWASVATGGPAAAHAAERERRQLRMAVFAAHPLLAPPRRPDHFVRVQAVI